MDMQNVNSGPSLYDTSIKKREMIDEVMFISCFEITFALCLFSYLCNFVWKDVFQNWLVAPMKVDNSSHIPRFCPKPGQFVSLELMTVDVRAQQWLSISGLEANNRKLVIKHFSHVSSLSLINSSCDGRSFWKHMNGIFVQLTLMNSVPEVFIGRNCLV